MGTSAAVLVFTAWATALPGLGVGQPVPPETPLDLDRRVFVDVKAVALGKVLDDLCHGIGCTLNVDGRLPQRDISLNLSNVRACTALDVLCDVVGCRWSVNRRILNVTATGMPAAGPMGQEWGERMRAPLAGDSWKLERVPLGDVLASLSRTLGGQVVFEGVGLGVPVTEDLRGRAYLDAVHQVAFAVGCNIPDVTMAVASGGGSRAIRVECRTQPGTLRGVPAAAPAPVYQVEDGGVTAPRVISHRQPGYPADVMRAKVRGEVELSLVVETDGSPGEVKVLKSLHQALDAEAIRAARQWRFEPGYKGGKPVRVQVKLQFTFELR